VSAVGCVFCDELRNKEQMNVLTRSDKLIHHCQMSVVGTGNGASSHGTYVRLYIRGQVGG